MGMMYANRGFLSINNQKLVDIKKIDLKVNRNSKIVQSMTSDSFATGFTQGNYDIELSFEIAVEDQLSSPQLELIDYSSVQVQATAQFGNNSDLWTLTGLFIKDVTTSAPAPGEEVSKTYNFSCLKIISGTGASSLFNIGQ